MGNLQGDEWRSSNKSVHPSPLFMPTTRNIKRGYTSNISTSDSTPSLPTPPASSQRSDLSLTAQSDSPALTGSPSASTAESPHVSESLPPRMRPKEKRNHFGEFRIIRELAPIGDHTTELKPIPSPPWANDSLDFSDNTRGKGTSHARTDALERRCTHSRNNSKSSAECSTTGSLQALSLSSPQHSGTETNTFPSPARPSRKQKRYACDVCGQIFTRSGDVRRHKESRHDNSEGCRCPFCDRVLTRQDALQRHWDKYCRKKSKRHLDKEAVETQTRTIPSIIPTIMYTPGAPPTQTTPITTTMGIGTVLDQSQLNYRYLNIFG